MLLNCHTRDRGRASVVPSELLGGYTATMHLIENGHSRIGFIRGRSDLSASSRRYDGFVTALHEAGLEVDSDLVQQGDYTYRSGL